MIPWSKLSEDVQKALLALVLMSGSSTVSGCCAPTICDPPPPPMTSTPTRAHGPTVSDPTAVPSSTIRRTPTPIICDPPPPPAISRTPGATPAASALRRFQIRRLEMAVDPTLEGAVVRGTVVDRLGRPLGQVKVTGQTTGTVVDTRTAENGSFALRIPNPGSWNLVIGDDNANTFPLTLKQYDVANVECAELGPTSQAPLPLAEIRSVDIVWYDDLTIEAETPWPDAHYRWSVTGGMLVEEKGHLAWRPPSQPGRYLLQVIAEWGPAGLAVDSLVFIVDKDGNVSVT